MKKIDGQKHLICPMGHLQGVERQKGNMNKNIFIFLSPFPISKCFRVNPLGGEDMHLDSLFRLKYNASQLKKHVKLELMNYFRHHIENLKSKLTKSTWQQETSMIYPNSCTFTLGARLAIRAATTSPAFLSIIELIKTRVMIPTKSCQSGSFPYCTT